MTDTVNTRRLALDVLLEVTEHGAYSNQVLRAVLEKYQYMEIVTIEKKTFELWKQRFEGFVGRMDALCLSLRRKQDKWLDNSEACRLLNVSSRTM